MQKTKRHKEFLGWFGQNNCVHSSLCYFFSSLRFYEWYFENFSGSPVPQIQVPFYTKRVLILAKLQSQLDNPWKSRMITAK